LPEGAWVRTVTSNPDARRSKPLAGKTAIVHAGVEGWAIPIVRALKEAGATVALAAGTPAVATVGATSGANLFLRGPFPDQGAVSSAAGRVVEQFTHLSILVNAPQVELFRPASDISDSDLRNLFECNVLPAYRWSKAVAAHMVKESSGRIINFVSGLSRRGLSNASAFAMTQAALDAMTQSLALEWSGAGIRVNGIGYGWDETTRRPPEEQQKERLVRFLPLRRKAHPDDLMGLLVYLASDASDFVTGQTIFIDGGAMAHA
jgi:NAD(P)-dependent dehydrogenase (short-subunit alcohol dehydrogenase family)